MDGVFADDGSGGLPLHISVQRTWRPDIVTAGKGACMRNSILAAVRRAAAAQLALDDGVRQVSFNDLNQLVEQERRWLSSFAVRDCALVAENSCGWVVSDLALMACGAANAAIPTNFTAEQISHA